MLIFDAHNDTLVKIKENNSTFYKNEFHIDIERLKIKENFEYKLCCAIFIHPKKNNDYFKKAIEVIDYIERELPISKNEMGVFVCNKQISLSLSLEGGHVLEGNAENIDYFYKRGIRSIGLTWNYNNELAGGCAEGNQGITKLGKDILNKMESCNMILDVSHISEKSFYEAIENFNGRVIASHSNSKSICNHVRNLSDDQIINISKRGGVIGVSFYPHFLNSSGIAGIYDIIKNIEYICALGGINCVGLGADFDGVDCLPAGINGIEDMDKLVNELLRLNYREEDVSAIMGKNFERIFLLNIFAQYGDLY